MFFGRAHTTTHKLCTPSSSLSECCKQWAVTEENLLFGVYCLLLHRKTGYSAFVVGYAFAGDLRSVPIQIDDNASALDAVRQTLDARDKLTDSHHTIGNSYAALFGGPDSVALLEETLAAGHIAAITAPGPEPDQPRTVRYLYDTDTFTDDEIHIHHKQLETLLADILANPEKPVRYLSVISEYEGELIRLANNTYSPYSDKMSIHELLEGVAARLPDAPALGFRNQELSYDMFNRKANRLAHTLCGLGAGPGTFVAIAAERCPELIVAMFAVLKTGAAFVPLSLRYPPEFLGLILRHADVKLLLTTAPTVVAPVADGTGVSVLDLNDTSLPPDTSQSTDSSQPAAPSHTSDANLPRATGFSPQSPAALIYTSGTTGRPKGVVVRHDTVVNYCEFNLREFHINEQDRIMQFAPFTFSTAILEITTTLIGGAKLCLVPEPSVMDPGAFYREMLAAEATILLAPPEYIGYLPLPPTLRIVETGASECKREISEKIIQTTQHANAYGLTEGCVPTVWKGCEGPRPRRIPIGKPVPNTQAYILDTHGEPCGLYMPGELCVTGLSVSDGYLGDPERTSERFVPNPFGVGVMLRTGDIAQWSTDGNIEYLGRTDNQIQIRGMRVELEEVERALTQMPGVAGTAALSRPAPNGDPQIVAFVTPARGADNAPASLDPEALRLDLYNRLLEHKVPSVIVPLEKLPMTPNGKIDKRALAALDIAADEFAAPLSREEDLIIRAFEETLGLTGIGTKANFFALGGHSLRAARATNLVEELSGIRLPLWQWFETPTVEGLAGVLKEALQHQNTLTHAAEYTPIPKAAPQDVYPMSPAQRRLYLACQIDDTGTAYNIPVALEFEGAPDTTRMQAALTALSQRQEILRTSFHIQTTPDNAFIQRITPPDQALLVLDIMPWDPSDTPESLLAGFVRPFDLAKAPLMRARAAVAPDRSRSVLLFDLHHIIADGTTMYLLLAEFETLYNTAVSSGDKPLTAPPLQYKDYSQWALTRDLSGQKAHWLSVFAEPAPALNLITDFPRRRRSYKGGEKIVVTDATLRDKIETLAADHGATPYMVLLAVLTVMLAKYTRQEDITVGTPAAGRVHQDLERVAGMFVNTVALRGRPARDKQFTDFLEEIRNTSLLAFENQEYPFEELTAALDIPQDPTRNPLFDVMLVMQNTEPFAANPEGQRYIRTVMNPESAKFDLTFDITERPEGYHIKLIYSTMLFRQESAEAMLRHYLALLDAATTDPAKTIGELSLASQ